ncbi:MAG: hypothetical protein Q8L72_05140 [Moraxellaceae bacterium]|nr:hypothetical protein [Moraxellaceae bacterium]
MKWALLITFLAATNAQADMFQPSHSCSKPYKPFQFTAQYEVDNYNNSVSRYKKCISDFVSTQNDAVNVHQKAASDAIEDWNRFVRFELN